MSVVASIRARMDGWGSALTGLGTFRDKLESYVFTRSQRLDRDQLEAMYHEDDMAAKLCDKPVQHMLSKPWEYDGLNEDVVQYLNSECTRLELKEKLVECLTWEALYGGSALFIGADDGRPMHQPLDIGALQNGRGVVFLSVRETDEVHPRRWYNELTDPKYGKPSSYLLVQNHFGMSSGLKYTLPDELEKLKKMKTLEVHESRLVIFPGRLVSKRERIREFGWGGSVVQRSAKALKIFHTNWQSVGHIMQDASQGVFKLKNLTQMIAEGMKDALQTRMEITDMSRSNARAILVDADTEDFTRSEASLANLDQLLDRSATRLAASADMPATVLHGISPAGMNATGESDIRNWYDVLQANRTEKLEPRLKQILGIFLWCKDSPCVGAVPTNWKLKWPSLWQRTEEEESQLRSTNASTDATLVQAAILSPEQVQKARWTKDGYQYRVDHLDFEAAAESSRLYKLLQEQRTTDQPAVQLDPTTPEVRP